MNSTKLLIIIVLFITSCGGGGHDSPSRFDGIWKGTLAGTDCNGVTINKLVRHEVDAESDELSSDVILVDQGGTFYRGEIDGTASISGPRYGFAVKNDEDSNNVIDYNIIKTPDGEARVFEFFVIPSGETTFPQVASITWRVSLLKRSRRTILGTTASLAALISASSPKLSTSRIMSADVCIIFYGIRWEVTDAEVEQLETCADERIRKARAKGLDHFWVGESEGRPAFLLVGRKLVVLGLENSRHGEIVGQELKKSIDVTEKQLVSASLDVILRSKIESDHL